MYIKNTYEPRLFLLITGEVIGFLNIKLNPQLEILSGIFFQVHCIFPVPMIFLIWLTEKALYPVFSKCLANLSVRGLLFG